MKQVSLLCGQAGLLLLLLLIHQLSFAQSPTQAWFRTFDGSGNVYDEIRFVRIDQQNNVVVTGNSGSGPGTMYDIVTRKYAPDGTLLWSLTWNNGLYNFDDRANDMDIAPNGNIIVTGYSKMSASSQDINSNLIVFAIDSNGNLLWSDSVKGSGYTSGGGVYINRNIGNELAIDAAANIYVAGQATGSSGNNEYDQMVLVKYNSAGQKQWTSFNDNSTGFPYSDLGTSIGLDGSGNAYVCGLVSLTATFRDFGMWKIDPSNQFLWVTTKGGSDNNTSEQADQIIVDNNGNSYTLGINSDGYYALVKVDASGSQQWTYVFDTISPSVSSAYSGADKYLSFDASGNVIIAAPMANRFGVAKMSPAGALSWLSLLGGTGNGHNDPYRVQCDGDNNIYVAGAVSMAGSNYYDIGAMKLDPAGNQLWMVTFNGPDSVNDKALSMAIAPDGGIYLGGMATGYSSSSDFFLIKYQQLPVSVGLHEPLTDANLEVYPNPTAGLLHLRCSPQDAATPYWIYNNMGVEVAQGKLQSTETSLNTRSWPSGMYVIRAGGKTQRLIKQ